MRVLAAIVCLFGCAGNPPPPAPEPERPAAVADAAPAAPDAAGPTVASVLEARLAEDTVRGPLALEMIAGPALRRFYAARDYRPAWTRRGVPTEDVAHLLDALAIAEEHGLIAAEYHVDELRALAARRPPTQPEIEYLAELDLVASDAFLALGGHLAAGLVDPTTLEEDWRAVRREVDMASVLRDALSTGDLIEALQAQAPDEVGYKRLLAAYARYRAIAGEGGWEPLPKRPSKQQLADRLAVEGFTGGKALASYQRARSLRATGRLDDVTRAALDAPIANRLRTLRANLERWRWMPAELGERHIIVDVPGFELTARDEGNTVMRSRIVVGRVYRQTPVFSGPLTQLVVNPTWTIPKTILTEDKLPEIQKNIDFLARHKIEVIDPKDQVVDPSTIDWQAFEPGRTRYRLRMKAGPQNPLGLLKFDIVNDFAVYLHDTDDRSLFAKGVRTFSSGCIRIQRPETLALWVLDGTEGWDKKALKAAIAAGTTQKVSIARPVMVHIQYFTARVDDEGRVVFVEDVYARDKRLVAALERAAADEDVAPSGASHDPPADPAPEPAPAP